jgi:hypothetical protein
MDKGSLDTTFVDDAVGPSGNYVYKAYYLYNLTVVDSSSSVRVTTLGASSGAFTWQMFSFGAAGVTSSLNDVFILSDTSVWAVGEIWQPDSVSSQYKLCNAAHWDGQSWRLLSIPTAYLGGTAPLVVELSAVSAFGSNDVWVFSISGSYAHWNGLTWATAYVPERSGEGAKFWGSSSSNLYLVGTNGSVSHFDGTMWQKFSSGTTLDINDIWGGFNSSGGLEILAAAGYPNSSGGRAILRIAGANVTEISDSGALSILSTVWFLPGLRYYTAGSTVYYKENSSDSAAWIQDPALDFDIPYVFSIRGNAINDIFTAAGDGLILHFDGYNWKGFANALLTDGNYTALSVKGDLVVAVGVNEGQAVIAMGWR